MDRTLVFFCGMLIAQAFEGLKVVSAQTRPQTSLTSPAVEVNKAAAKTPALKRSTGSRTAGKTVQAKTVQAKTVPDKMPAAGLTKTRAAASSKAEPPAPVATPVLLNLPVGKFADFALSGDASSLSAENPVYAKIKRSHVIPQIVSQGEGFVRIRTDSTQTTLNIPLGWCASDMFGGSYVYTPDETVQISLNNIAGKPFAELKRRVPDEFEKSVGHKVEQFETADGGFAVKASDYLDPVRGKTYSMIRIFSPRPNNSSGEGRTLTLKTPSGQLDKYLPLVGAILKDRLIDWNFHSITSDFEDMSSSSGEYTAFAKNAVQLLIKGDRAAFDQILSPLVKKDAGMNNVDQLLTQPAVEFFKDVDKIQDDPLIARGSDGFGNSGFTIYETALDKQGKEKPFVVFVIKENGALVINNLVLNKTFQQLH